MRALAHAPREKLGVSVLVWRTRKQKICAIFSFLDGKNVMATKSIDSSRVSLTGLMFADVHGEDRLSSYGVLLVYFGHFRNLSNLQNFKPIDIVVHFIITVPI